MVAEESFGEGFGFAGMFFAAIWEEAAREWGLPGILKRADHLATKERKDRKENSLSVGFPRTQTRPAGESPREGISLLLCSLRSFAANPTAGRRIRGAHSWSG
jgi:hypothetical protein